MKKRLISAILIIVTLFSLSTAALASTAAAAPAEIRIFVDGRQIATDAPPFLQSGRTLIPISTVAQTLGARVDWNSSARTVTITRAWKEIIMVIDEKTATVNGETIELDVAPFIRGGRTFLPLRFVAEQFSQEVLWDPVSRSVLITEDMSFAYEDSNISEWFLGCGAILARVNNSNPYLVGMRHRSASNASWARQMLSGSWGCDDRADLIFTIFGMALEGHAADFAYNAYIIDEMSDREFNDFIMSFNESDRVIWRLVRSLNTKWGDRGIIAWDWFRVFHLAGWGYLAGYLDLSEAYSLMEPVARALQEEFSSWDEATENYMDGYAYWSRTDVSKENTEYRRRLQIYENLKAEQEQNGLLFDESVWTEPVKGVREDWDGPGDGS